MEKVNLIAIGDEMEINDNERKEVKKKLQQLVIALKNKDISEIEKVAKMTILTEPEFRGVLKSLVDQAVAEAIVKNIFRLL